MRASARRGRVVVPPPPPPLLLPGATHDRRSLPVRVLPRLHPGRAARPLAVLRRWAGGVGAGVAAMMNMPDLTAGVKRPREPAAAREEREGKGMPSLEMPSPGPGEPAPGGPDGDEDDADMKIGDDKIVRLEANAETAEEEQEYEIDPVSMMENVRMAKLMRDFTEEQSARYEAFRRSGFNTRQEIKHIMSSVCGYDIDAKRDADTLIAVQGAVKVLVGQLVEESLLLMNERGMGHEEGISPGTLREAHQRLVDRGEVRTKVRRRCPLL